MMLINSFFFFVNVEKKIGMDYDLFIDIYYFIRINLMFIFDFIR